MTRLLQRGKTGHCRTLENSWHFPLSLNDGDKLKQRSEPVPDGLTVQRAIMGSRLVSVDHRVRLGFVLHNAAQRHAGGIRHNGRIHLVEIACRGGMARRSELTQC